MMTYILVGIKQDF